MSRQPPAVLLNVVYEIVLGQAARVFLQERRPELVQALASPRLCLRQGRAFGRAVHVAYGVDPLFQFGVLPYDHLRELSVPHVGSLPVPADVLTSIHGPDIEEIVHKVSEALCVGWFFVWQPGEAAVEHNVEH